MDLPGIQRDAARFGLDDERAGGVDACRGSLAVAPTDALAAQRVAPVPGAHHGGSGDQAVVEGVRIDPPAGVLIGVEDGVGGFVIPVEDAGVPDDGGEVPFDRALEGVLPIGPQQAESGVEEVAGMGVAVEGLGGKSPECGDGRGEPVAQQAERGGWEERAFFEGLQQVQTFG